MISAAAQVSCVRVPVGLALAAVVGGALVLRSWLPLHEHFVLKAALLGVAAALLAWPWLRAAGAQSRFGAANAVTLLRAVLVVLLAALLGESAEATPIAASATALAGVAALLDGVDGWIARRSGTATDFGARFDMETDALLILVLALLAWQWGKAGPWVLLAGLARYAFIAAARLLAWMRRRLPPSRRRRVVCVLQTAALIACLAPAVAPPASALLAAAGLAALLLSFALDIHWLARQARSHPLAEFAP